VVFTAWTEALGTGTGAEASWAAKAPAAKKPATSAASSLFMKNPLKS
jgi:hypothetical protein